MRSTSESTKIALAVVVVIAIAGAFWLLLLAPKREKNNELSEQNSSIAAEVQTVQESASLALSAKRDFPTDYQRLVGLGKAVPAESGTPSLLVQLNTLGNRARTSFVSIQGGAGGEGGSGEAAPEAALGTAIAPVGAIPGPSGLLAMPYSLEFEGGFFDIAQFLEGLDSQVETKPTEVDAHGRLVTVDGFNIVPVSPEAGVESGVGLGPLKVSFGVSTYVTPPGQGITAGATPAGPAETSPDLP